MGASYATVNDIETYWRNLTTEEETTAAQMIADVSAKIRLRASRCGKNFDDMIAANEDLAATAKTVVCQSVINAMKMQEAIPATQFSESASGYTVSGTFLTPGGGVKISKADWRELGLGGQRYGGLDVYGID